MKSLSPTDAPPSVTSRSAPAPASWLRNCARFIRRDFEKDRFGSVRRKHRCDAESGRCNYLPVAGRLSGRDQFVAGRQDGNARLARNLQRRMVHRRRDGNVPGRQSERSAKKHVPLREIQARNADEAALRDVFLKLDAVSFPLHRFLNRDGVRSFRNDRSGKKPDRLGGTEPQTITGAGRGCSDNGQLRTRSSIFGAHRITVHRGDGLLRMGYPRGEALPQRPPAGVAKADLLGANRLDERADSLDRLPNRKHGPRRPGTRLSARPISEAGGCR